MPIVRRVVVMLAFLLLATPSTYAAAACPSQPMNADGTSITSPAPNAVVTSPFTIKGNYYGSFEGVVPIRILDASGNAFIEANTMNECCVLARYSSKVSFTVGGSKPACIVVYRESGKDGSLTPLAQIPVTLSPVAGLPNTGETPLWLALLALAATILAAGLALRRRAAGS